MKIFKELFILFLLCWVGEAISIILPFSFPASVISMILLSLLLITKIIKPDYIVKTAEFLLKNMAFFFLPAGVAIMKQLDFMKDNIIIVLLICLISTFLTFTATVYTVMFARKIQNRKKSEGI